MGDRKVSSLLSSKAQCQNLLLPLVTALAFYRDRKFNGTMLSIKRCFPPAFLDSRRGHENSFWPMRNEQKQCDFWVTEQGQFCAYFPFSPLSLAEMQMLELTLEKAFKTKRWELNINDARGTRSLYP